ncbi:nephrin-like isoform X2 [Tubulanus polymorphus]|uniref:nephrin-like isoform X2 n=1 Tax=Tubulanus polymorphus TaxID=672921 RepID=UPI003DA56E7E
MCCFDKDSSMSICSMYRNKCLVVILVLCLMLCSRVNGVVSRNCHHQRAAPAYCPPDPPLAPPIGPVLKSQPFPVRNNIVTVQENSPLIITCDGSQSGATGLMYIWSGVNLSGRSNNRLSFTRISKTDSGVYTCTVSNMAGAVTGRITINVQSLAPPIGPVLKSQPFPVRNNIVTVQENSPLIITCDGSQSGATGLTYKWSGVNLSGQSNNILRFRFVRRTDSGVYTCTVSNMAGAVTGRITINVQYPPHRVTLQGPTSAVQESTSILLTCTASGGNPAPNLAITRTRGGSIAKQGVRHLTYSTSVAKTDNQAEYQCTATGTAILTPMISNKVRLTVYYPPSSVTLQGPTSPVHESTSIAIRCTSTGGNPIPTLAITRTPGDSTVKRGVSPLKYSKSVTKTDNQAEYQCTATGAGIPTPMISSKVKLTVYYPADSVSLTPIKSVITKGNSIRLNCAASGGNPDRFTYEWKFSTGSGVWKSIGSTNDHLALNNLSKVDSGQYRCQATNTGGLTISNIAIVDVQYAPKLSREFEPVAAQIGESLEFAINYDANPTATTLNCKHDGANFETNVIKTSLMQWGIIIQSVQASDYGSYSCRLKNSIGGIEVTLKLIQAGPPQTPSNLSIVAKTAVSVTLNWFSEFEGGSEQTFTASYRASNSTKSVNKTEIPDPGYRKLVQTKVTGLKPATDYQFKVKSVNLNRGDNTSPFADIVTAKTNAIPTSINTVLKQATIAQEGNLVLVKLSSFPSKYSVYVEYCTKDTNQCNSTKPKKTDGSISITFKIDPGHEYNYKLIVTESSDVIVSKLLQLKEEVDDKRTLVPLIIACVVLGSGSIAFTLVMILLIVLLIIILRNGVWNMRGKKTDESTLVYSNSNEAHCKDSHAYAAAKPFENVAFSAESEIEPNHYEEVKK